nr:MAG TPA: hypothetical protein [Caudoviricetes sp.]
MRNNIGVRINNLIHSSVFHPFLFIYYSYLTM